MNIVRKIIDSELIEPVIALPGSFRHKKVEVLVLPIIEQSAEMRPTNTPTAFGALKRYANPSLIAQEGRYEV